MPHEPPSSSIIDPMLQAGEDAIGGSEDAKAEEVVTKKKTAKLKKVYLFMLSYFSLVHI